MNNDTPNIQQMNPLLSRLKIPGQTFQLPSGGVLYKNGELDGSTKNGEVHVYPMTAYDEILLKTPDKLFSGDAVKEVFSRCIPAVLKPLELFTKDVDYLLVCLRLVTFGHELSFNNRHTCKDAHRHDYTFDVRTLLKQTRTLDPTTLEKTFSVSMPNNQIVHVQPLRFKDYVAISHMDINEVETPEELFTRTIKSLLTIIPSVESDGQLITDPVLIEEWLRAISAEWLHKISDTISKSAEWGPSFITTVVCKDCKEEYSIDVPLNPVIFF